MRMLPSLAQFRGAGRCLALTTALAMTCLASAQAQFENPGHRVRPFSVLGSDGRKYSARTSGGGRPVLLVNLTERGFPLGIGDLNRLSCMTAGKVRGVGVVWASLHTMRETVKRYRLRFLLVSSYRNSTGELLKNCTAATGTATTWATPFSCRTAGSPICGRATTGGT